MSSKQRKFVADLQEGDQVSGVYLATAKTLQDFKEKNKGQFLSVTIADRSGQIPAILWDEAVETEARLKAGALVEVKGKVNTWRGNLQVYLDSIRPSSGPFDKELFLPVTPQDLDELQARLKKIMALVGDPYLKKVLNAFFGEAKWAGRFADCPAGYSWHQAYLGGLLEHTVNICELGLELMKKYPELDKDLLLTGALLHDIGKMEEYVYETSIGISDEGRLLGHIVIGETAVAEKIRNIPDFPEELAWQLRHLIISHHGERANGSPKRPKTAEAIALHLLDNLDAQVSAYSEVIKRTRAKGKAWSDHIKLIDRPLFTGLIEEAEDKDPDDRPSLFS